MGLSPFTASHRTAGCMCKPRVSCVCVHTPGFKHLLGHPHLTLLSPLFMFRVISKRDFGGYSLAASKAAAQTGKACENRELGVRRGARAFSPLLCCRAPPLCWWQRGWARWPFPRRSEFCARDVFHIRRMCHRTQLAVLASHTQGRGEPRTG